MESTSLKYAYSKHCFEKGYCNPEGSCPYSPLNYPQKDDHHTVMQWYRVPRLALQSQVSRSAFIISGMTDFMQVIQPHCNSCSLNLN